MGIRVPTVDVNGIHHFQYTIRVENCGNVSLDSIQVTDDLAALFALADSFYLEGQPAGSLDPNPDFDGVTDMNLLSGTETWNQVLQEISSWILL